MTILYFFPEYSTPMFSWQRVHIFDELQKHDVEIDAFNPLVYGSYDESNEKLLNKAKKGKYDMFLTCICSEKMLYFSTLEEIKKLGIPTVSFRPDNLMIPYNDRRLAPHFDLLWLTSVETQHLYDKWGVNTIFLPYAANPYSFQYKMQSIDRKVVFIGTPYGSRTRMINALTDNGVYVDLFYGGNNQHDSEAKIDTRSDIIQRGRMQVMWDRLFYKEGRKDIWGRIVNCFKGNIRLTENGLITHYPSVNPCELSDYYGKYALCLASTSANHTDILSTPLKIINLRNFEIPMSGGVEICKYNSELAGYFEEEKEIIFYRDNDELVDKAKYYTEKATDRELYTIKSAARKRAENEHSWWSRFNIIFKTIGIIR